MKRILMVLAAFGLLGAGAAQADNYKVDPAHAYALFGVRHLNIATSYGRFNKIGGSIVWDEADPSKSSFNIEIAAASVDTGVKKRDDHLRGPDFFNVKQHPKLSFKSTSVVAQGEIFKVTGRMTINGTTKEITVDVEMTGAGKDPWGDFRRGWQSDFIINRSEYGMKFMPGGLGEQVKITLAFEGIKR